MRRSIGTLLASAAAVVALASPAAATHLEGDFDCVGATRFLEFLERDGPAPAHRPPVGDLVRRLRRAWTARVARRVASECVHLNEIQVLGSHNSYHERPAPSAFQAISDFSPAFAIGFDYTHPPLDEQFGERGIRQIELDVFYDPEGGLYASPFLPDFLPLLMLPPDPDHDPDDVLLEPGLKVLHVQDVDFRSNCLTFVRCLETIRTWSDAHPGHLPLVVLVEAKDEDLTTDPALGMLPFVVPLPIDAAALDAIDAEIRSVFPDGQLLTPDDVRGDRETLEEALLDDGWPTLGDARGRVLFALDNGGATRDRYVDGHPALRGRVLFTDSPPGSPEAAFAKRNGPLGNEAEIADLVSRGYIVRTRADADTVEARLNQTGRRDAALASGAQFVSTDYPVPNPEFGSGYEVRIPGGMPGRCNPVNAPPGCRAEALEQSGGSP